MSDGGVLANLVSTKFSADAEDIATEALAYVLESYPEASRALVGELRAFCPGLEDAVSWQTQAYGAGDQAIPDLVAQTASRSFDLIIEAKFWAGLTVNQPVTYLRRLPSDRPTLLAFLVPDRRQAAVYGEVLRRCQETDDLATDEEDAAAHHATIGNRHLVVITWNRVLGILESALEAVREEAGLGDLRQLKGLCSQQDNPQFRPLTSEEITGTAGQRMRDFITIIGESTDQANNLGIASTTGRTFSASTDFSGRYFFLSGWECLLHVNYWRWSQQRPTPIWLQITDKAAVASPSFRQALDSLRRERPPRLFEDSGKLQIPVELPLGVEIDEVVRTVVEQLQEVANLLPDRVASADGS